ncbi:unnamed protein product [Porites lobata]|uniref:Sulfotransferase family protein n=1 Tax=Porites lobata TaxID=104759 RepID=A0ABN8N741_9CNID|nr:unnamed protein product [Porites lobata]
MRLMSEPFSASFYFGPQRQSCRYESKEADSKASYENVAREILNQANDDNIDLLFVKDMACYMKGRLGFLKEYFQDAKHSFLIRNPKKSIPSQYRASENPEIQDSGWNYFDPQEAGFQELFEMYSFVKDNLDANPVVVDADDLLESPKQIMKEYFDRVGIKYEEHMTTWKPGEIIQAWQDVWVIAWRRGALNSSDSGWNYFDPQEAGFQELFEMYSFVKDNLDANPVVVDADDLLESPKQIMKEYCDRVGIKYEEHMTTWKPGEIIQAWQDGWVIAWRRGALNSSGFIKSDTSSSKPEIEYPSDVVKAMEDSQAFYDKMFSVRLRLA